MKRANTLFLAALILTPAAARALGNQAVLGTLFDDRDAAAVSAYASGVGAPVVGETRAAKAAPGSFEAAKAETELFIKAFSGRLLAVPGVLGVYSGIDCPVREVHTHIRPHMPAVVIRLDGRVSDRLVFESIRKQIPQISQVIYRLELAPDAEPLAGEVRCWLYEGCRNP